jgi:DNA-binding transcriptional LysR family regulator
MSFELRHLRHALGLAEYGSFARAAVALHLSQPALSRSIQSLEQQLGMTLFVRSSDGVVPTDRGRLFLERARDLVRLADDLDDEVLGPRGEDHGAVAAGGGPFVASSVLAFAVTAFLERHPGASLRLPVGNWDELLRLLRNRELDFFVAEFSTFEGDPDLEVEPLPVEPIVFVARAGHPLAGRGAVTMAEVFAWPMLVMSRIPPRVLEPLLAAQRIARDALERQRAVPALECSSLATVKRIVEASDGIAAVTLPCVRSELEEGRWTVIATAPWLQARYGVVRIKGRPMTRAAQAFRELVLAASADAAAEQQLLARKWQPRLRDGTD